jgi:hypothetical protein
MPDRVAQQSSAGYNENSNHSNLPSLLSGNEPGVNAPERPCACTAGPVRDAPIGMPRAAITTRRDS